jgi:hypothetical protein
MVKLIKTRLEHPFTAFCIQESPQNPYISSNIPEKPIFCIQRIPCAKREASDNRTARENDTMNLHLLDFDGSEDADGVTCWDALAHPPARYTSALLAEVSQLLAWAHRFSAAGPGPLEDGADWDYDLSVTLHGSSGPPQGVSARASFDPAQGHLHLVPQPTADQTLELGLSLSGTPGFGQAFRDQWLEA